MSSNHVWQTQETEQRIRARHEAAAAHRLVREARAGSQARVMRQAKGISATVVTRPSLAQALKGLLAPARPCEHT